MCWRFACKNMDPNLKCCVFGCQSRPNQGLRFYRFPCHNPQISSIWEQRICQSTNIDFLNDRVCELHFDYRCKTGNECALEEGSLPTLHLPSFGTLFSTGNAHFQMSANRIEEPSYTISIDALSYHCRFCLRRGLLYDAETSTYRSKSFMSLIDLPPNVVPDNTQPNACLSCLKSIMIAHQLSMSVKHSNTILQLLLQHPKQSKVMSKTNIFDMKSELASCNLILANSLSIKLEIEFEDNMVWDNEDYEQKWVAIGEPTLPAAYVNTQNMVEESICIAEYQDNVSDIHDSVTYKQWLAIGGEYMTDLSVEGISIVREHSYSCVLMEDTDDNVEVMVSKNSDDYCAEGRQFDNEQASESTSKAVNEPTYKCDFCKFTTNYKANISIHKNLHLTVNDTVHFYCQKCEKDFLLRRHFVRHNTIFHADDFTCKICEKPYASATKLAVHYTEHHYFQCGISSKMLRSEHYAHMLDHKQGQTIFTSTIAHWNGNDGVHVCPICDFRNPSFHTFNVHMGKHKVQIRKNNAIGSQKLEILKTDSVGNADGRYHCTDCTKAFRNKSHFREHRRIHTYERPYKCTKCPKAFRNKSHLIRHKRTHTNEKPYKCTDCPSTVNRKSSLVKHKRIHTIDRPYKCTECPKTFIYMSKFNLHKKIHTNEKPYECIECPKAFRNKDKLTEHKRIHSNDRPYKCTECSKTFRQSSTLVTHKRIHTNERPYKCSGCPKTFSQKSNCENHKRIHTNERPYKCTECPKDFVFKSALNVHKKIHTNERPYKCTECPKTFSLKSYCDSHKIIHTNERPYKCAECPKDFNFKCALNVHKRIHTSERTYKFADCRKN